MENNRAYLLHTEITKSHLNNRICQHCGVKTSTVTPSFYYVFNVSLSCNINIPSFIGNLWWVVLLGNHLKSRFEVPLCFSISVNYYFQVRGHNNSKCSDSAPLTYHGCSTVTVVFVLHGVFAFYGVRTRRSKIVSRATGRYAATSFDQLLVCPRSSFVGEA